MAQLARIRGGEESFASQPFGDLSQRGNILLNFQHQRARPLARTGGGGLVLTDSAERLEVAATLPMTRDADDALTLVDEGILQGFSIEFPGTSQEAGRYPVNHRFGPAGGYRVGGHTGIR